MLRLTSSLWLLAYFPLETWISWPALYHPLYLIALAGMLLMAWGIRLAGQHARDGAVVLSVAWAWTAANFWRGTVDRFEAHAQAVALDFGPSERWMGVALTLTTILMTTLAMRVAFRRSD